MKPRQPAAATSAAPGANSSPKPASRSCCAREKMRRVAFDTSSLDEKGHFFAPCENRLWKKHAGFMKALKCRECGREYPLTANHVCEFDFGPLEVAYDYERIKQSMTRAAIQSRPKNMWRFREVAADRRRADRRPGSGLHAIDQGRPPGQAPGHPRIVDQERRRQLSDALLQGPRGQRRL